MKKQNSLPGYINQPMQMQNNNMTNQEQKVSSPLQKPIHNNLVHTKLQGKPSQKSKKQQQIPLQQQQNQQQQQQQLPIQNNIIFDSSDAQQQQQQEIQQQLFQQQQLQVENEQMLYEQEMETTSHEEEEEEEEEEEDINNIDSENNIENIEIDRVYLQQLIVNEDKFFQKIVEMNDEAAQKLTKGKQTEALNLLLKAEKILEFAAQCGKSIDRNLIIVVLYNRACAYQSLWILDKCSKYVDGVIYNLEISLEEEEQKQLQKKSTDPEQEKFYVSHRAKKYTFLAKCYLQYCAILSQLGLHQQALDTAKQTIKVLQKIFQDCYQYCIQQQVEQNQILDSLSNLYINQAQKPQQQQQKPLQKKKGQNNLAQPKSTQSLQSQSSSYSQQQLMQSQSQTQMKQMQKEQILFSKQVIDYATQILRDLTAMPNLEEGSAKQSVMKHFEQARKSLYFWKNNPENNERHIRQELNVPLKQSPRENRTLLGVANGSEWIENFNIGTIMHMNSISYQDFTYFGDILYEISKRNILEKVIYLSICYFTIATEIRFLEIDSCKNNKIQEQEGFKRSEIYHLKSIEIVCKYIVSKSPYINHLITSYHKHYNQNLEIIQEEQSICSAVDQSNVHASPVNSIHQSNPQLVQKQQQSQFANQIEPVNFNKNFEQFQQFQQNFMEENQEQDLSNINPNTNHSDEENNNIFHNTENNNQQQQMQQQNFINSHFNQHLIRNSDYQNQQQQFSQDNQQDWDIDLQSYQASSNNHSRSEINPSQLTTAIYNNNSGSDFRSSGFQKEDHVQQQQNTSNSQEIINLQCDEIAQNQNQINLKQQQQPKQQQQQFKKQSQKPLQQQINNNKTLKKDSSGLNINNNKKQQRQKQQQQQQYTHNQQNDGSNNNKDKIVSSNTNIFGNIIINSTNSVPTQHMVLNYQQGTPYAQQNQDLHSNNNNNTEQQQQQQQQQQVDQQKQQQNKKSQKNLNIEIQANNSNSNNNNYRQKQQQQKQQAYTNQPTSLSQQQISSPQLVQQQQNRPQTTKSQQTTKQIQLQQQQQQQQQLKQQQQRNNHNNNKSTTPNSSNRKQQQQSSSQLDKKQQQKSQQNNSSSSKNIKQNYFQNHQFPWRKHSENNALQLKNLQNTTDPKFLEQSGSQTDRQYTQQSERLSTTIKKSDTKKQCQQNELFSQLKDKKLLQQFKKQSQQLFSQKPSKKSLQQQQQQQKQNKSNLSSQTQKSQIAANSHLQQQQKKKKPEEIQISISNNNNQNQNYLQQQQQMQQQQQQQKIVIPSPQQQLKMPIKKETIKQLLKTSNQQKQNLVPKLNFSNIHNNNNNNNNKMSTTPKSKANPSSQNNNNNSVSKVLKTENSVQGNNSGVRFYSPRETQVKKNKKPQTQLNKKTTSTSRLFGF